MPLALVLVLPLGDTDPLLPALDDVTIDKGFVASDWLVSFSVLIGGTVGLERAESDPMEGRGTPWNWGAPNTESKKQ